MRIGYVLVEVSRELACQHVLSDTDILGQDNEGGELVTLATKYQVGSQSQKTLDGDALTFITGETSEECWTRVYAADLRPANRHPSFLEDFERSVWTS